MLLYAHRKWRIRFTHIGVSLNQPPLTLIFMSLFLLDNLANEVTAKEIDIHHASHGQTCLACHQTLPRQLAMASDCVSCHATERLSQDQSTRPLITASTIPGTLAFAVGGEGEGEGRTSAAMPKVVSAQSAAKFVTPRALTLPLYYDITHIGANPNEMLRVPAGKFIMGTDARLSDEGPQHTVQLPSYWIDKYEVTNLQYQQFIEATGKRAPDHFANRTFPSGKADHPVTFVSWHDANSYCAWAGKRLPTDQEWEKAARGTDGRMFPWGSQFDINQVNTPVRWERLKQAGDTTPVGAFPGGASPYGALDMSGNVWEWTASWYSAYPGNKKISENYEEIYKTLKGGSWWDCSFYKCGISAPVFNRAFFNVKVKNASFGFRCAKNDK